MGKDFEQTTPEEFRNELRAAGGRAEAPAPRKEARECWVLYADGKPRPISIRAPGDTRLETPGETWVRMREVREGDTEATVSAAFHAEVVNLLADQIAFLSREKKAAEAKLRALEGATREVVKHYRTCGGLHNLLIAAEALEKMLSEPHPTKGEETRMTYWMNEDKTRIYAAHDGLYVLNATVVPMFADKFFAALQNQQEKK